MSFASSLIRTLNPKGSEVTIAEREGGDSKRSATLQVTICADPRGQVVKLEIYFRGMGLQLTEEELDHYDSLTNIRVRFQPTAWADEDICLEYLQDFRADTIHLGEVLLGMDRHSAQSTFLCEGFMERYGIVPAYTPANCTDVVSPVDHHVGAGIKRKMYAMYEAAFDSDPDKFTSPAGEGGLTAKDKRMLMATWASKSWESLCTDNQHLIRQAFVSTGFLLAKDGSENHLVNFGMDYQGKYNF